MLSYNDLYEFLRKEKYSETLQPLPPNFISEFKSYLKEIRETSSFESNLFSIDSSKSKKQLENALSLFKEIMLKRKKKILNLVFVATETGLLKRDQENMLFFEKEMFEKMIQICDNSEKQLSQILHEEQNKKEEKNKMVLFKQNVDQFIDHKGNIIGPFKPKDLANIDAVVADILVSEGKASFIEEA